MAVVTALTAIAFVTIITFSGPLYAGPATAHQKLAERVANNNVKALRACMDACRARTKACYASGNTGSCKSRHIACIAACQNSISSEAPQKSYKLFAGKGD
jgi:hypothetical protein